MMTTSRRNFTGAPAVRGSIPLGIGLYGPSGAGKTYSALRLAKGVQSISGGKIALGDTENGRALHYAGEFDFVHYPFEPPFDPMSYLALLQQMESDGMAIAIIDSASHEHEGQGGVLEMHEAECDRLMRQWKTTRDKVQMSAWAKPKQQRRKMIQGALRSPMHIIWCFRAKEKLEVRKGKPPAPLGFMPIAAEELVYEMAMTALLLPGAQGVPTWQSQESGERQMIKLPHWARAMLRSGPLDEELGAALAKWAKGDIAMPKDEGSTEEEDRLELRSLYDMLSESLRRRFSKAIPSREAIDTLAMPRVRKGIEVLREAVYLEHHNHAPRAGQAPSGMTWTEWTIQGDTWRGHWALAEEDLAGMVECGPGGVAVEHVQGPEVAAEDLAWAWGAQ